MKVTVLFFGVLKEIFGSSELGVELPCGSRVEDLTTYLGLNYPESEFIRSAVNEEFSNRHHELNDQDTVAFLPPVAGG